MVGSAYWILTSRWSRAFRAIRENEMRAAVVGVSLRNYKLMAFAIGAGYAGIGGALFAPLLGYIDQKLLDFGMALMPARRLVVGEEGRPVHAAGARSTPQSPVRSSRSSACGPSTGSG